MERDLRGLDARIIEVEKQMEYNLAFAGKWEEKQERKADL